MRSPGWSAREALAWGRAWLGSQESVVREDTPALDAEVLLRHVLDVSRAELYTHPERLLTPAQRRRYTTLMNRRVRGAPVAYLTGLQEFMGLAFRINRHVLIPRPDTERLVELALAHLPADGAGLVAADVGTGSGAIALALASARPALQVRAIDVSAAALKVARTNARGLLGPRQRRVRFLHGSLLAPLPAPVHLIAANLPYIAAPELPGLPAPVRDYEPALALDGGPDGLDFYRALLRQAPTSLLPGGALLMECDPRQAAPLATLAQRAFPAARVTVHRDLAGRDRVVEAGTPA